MRLKPLIVNSMTAVLLMAAPTITVTAAPKTPTKTTLTRIEEESEGNVEFDIPDNLMNIIIPPVVKSTGPAKKTNTKTVKANVLHSGVNKLSGYRVQVFSQGHGQGSVEARARARASAVVAKFPKYRGQVYSYSQAPNWYTRVGNFQTSAQASAALAELKRAFPQFAGEMRLVKCQITIIK